MLSFKKTVLLTSALVASTLAFSEESRSGFYLSGGLGLHSTELTMTIDNYGSGSDSNSGLLTSIKLGGYINPTFALYYLREAAWWTDVDAPDALFTGGITGLGGSYYFQPSKGGYLEFGVGLGDLVINENGNIASETGTAFQLGGGIEVSEHIQIGGSLISTSLPDSYYVDVTYSTFSLAAKVEFKL